MKKAGIVCLLIACFFLLSLTAAAVPMASGVKSESVFQTDGSCQVTLSMTVQLMGDETFIDIPLPEQTKGVTVRGYQCQFPLEGEPNTLRVEISGAGSHQITIHYTLEDIVSQEEEGTFVTLPILCGLHYVVSHLDFTVTLPGEVTAQPVFESGYYQQNVGGILEYTVEGATISGRSKLALKDRETLTMRLQVPEDLFHDAPWQLPVLGAWDLVLLLLIVLSVVYFLLTLMPKFPGRNRSFTPPEGITAGDVGTCLTGCGTDLTMLVLSWAQMGYILIEMDHKNRVILHKRMDMGNERSGYEARWFKSLFGQRSLVDADSYHYAKLCRKLATKSPLRSQLYDKKSGNPQIFRGMCVIIGIVAGVQMGLGFDVSAGAKTLLSLLFALLCGSFSYFIQAGGKCLPLREKTPLWTAMGCGAAWIALALLTGNAHQAVPMVLYQFVAGIAAAYGGKRSDVGLRYLGQLRGLKRHMRVTGSFDLQQLLQQNPNYFYELAPYALALGVDRSFARRFGKLHLPEDSYLLSGTAREMTAAQFASRLRKAADVLNERQKRLPYEQLRGK